MSKELSLSEPFKPTSPTPLSPLLKALTDGEKKASDVIEDLEAKLTKSLLKTQETVEKIVCGCENKCKSDSDKKKSSDETMKELLTVEEIKQLVHKLEVILHEKIFKSIAKRSVADEEDETKSFLKTFERVKDLFSLDDKSKMDEFKTKLMAMPENKKVPLNLLVESIIEKTEETIVEKNEDCLKKTKIECPIGHQLKIHRASITNKKKYVCPSTSSSRDLSDEICTEETKALKIVTDKCEGERMCKLSVDSDFDGLCECSSPRYLNMTYTCEPVAFEGAAELREKRALHYRNRPRQEDRDRLLRNSEVGVLDYGFGLGFGGPFLDYYDYYGYGGFGPLYDYYGYGYPFLDYYGYGGFGLGYDYYGYGGFGLGYGGFGPFDYYYGYGPFDYYYDGAIIYDY